MILLHLDRIINDSHTNALVYMWKMYIQNCYNIAFFFPYKIKIPVQELCFEKDVLQVLIQLHNISFFMGLWNSWNSIHIMEKFKYFSGFFFFGFFWKECGFTVIAAGRNASCLSNWQWYFVYADGGLTVTTDAWQLLHETLLI